MDCEREIMKPILNNEMETVWRNHGGNDLILKLFHDINYYITTGID